MVSSKFVELFEIMNFVFLTIFPYLVYFNGKIEFSIFTETFFMDITRTIGKK